MKTLFLFLIILMTVVCAVAFTVLNPGSIDLNLYVARFRLPLAAAILLSTLVGVLLGFMVSSVSTFSKAREIKRLSKQLQNAQTELSNLRKLPIEEP